MNVAFFIYTVETKQELDILKYLLKCQEENKDCVFVFDVTMPSEKLVPKFEYYVYFEHLYFLQDLGHSPLTERLSKCEKGLYNVTLDPNDRRRIYEFKPVIIK